MKTAAKSLKEEEDETTGDVVVRTLRTTPPPEEETWANYFRIARRHTMYALHREARRTSGDKDGVRVRY